MSRSTWLRALMALTTTLLLVTGFFSVPAMADDTPPWPTPKDRCAMDQDEFIVPDLGDGYGYYDFDWNPYLPDTYSTESAATVSGMLYGPDGYEDQWTLAYTNQPCTGSEAPNKGWAVVGQCYEQTGRTAATMFFENVDDPTDRFIEEVRVTVTEESLTYLSVTDAIGRVYDGEVESVKVGRAEALLYGEEYAGLGPGWFVAKFYRDDNDVVIARTRFFVPACGDEEPPPPPTLRKARGLLSLARCGKVRVITNTVGYTKTPRVTYRVIKFKVGRPRTAVARSFTVPADTRRVSFTKVRPRVRTVVVLKVERPSKVWDELDRLRTRRC